MKADYFKFKTKDETPSSPIFNKHDFLMVRCGACAVLFITILFSIFYSRSTFSHAQKPMTTSNGPAIEQQIDIQDGALSTTSSTYTDASGSGDFLWNSARYASLTHVYFEAGISKNGALATTKRIRSADLLGDLVDGTAYKVRIEYGCTYNSTTNIFTETGYAELWSADNTIEVTSSAVSNTVNTGSGTCPTTPTVVGVRFSRLIILQADPNLITDTDTSINLGQTETATFSDTNTYPLNYPKIWMYTSHALHPAGGWDSIQDILFSATIASPSGNTVSACLYDITSNTQITCVSTSNTTLTYVTSGDVSALLTDGDQYETYLNVSTPPASVALSNSFVTVEQSNPSGLSTMELYDDFNPYPVISTTSSYSHHYFMNDWEPANFNLDTTQQIPSSSETLTFHLEATEETTASIGSSTLFADCIPGGVCSNKAIFESNVDTSSSTYTRVRTADSAFPMQPNFELDSAFDVTGTGRVTSTVTWLIMNVNLLATYAVQETTNLAYGPNALEIYDQCLPVNAPPNRPGLIIIHGGGWIGEDKSNPQYQTLCNAYATEGYDVYNIDYRLASKTTSKDNPWPDPVGDIQLAVRYMRANSAQIGLDSTHICSYGTSSGSQLAALLDELQTIYPSDVSTIDANYSPTTECAVDTFGPVDLVLEYNENAKIAQECLYPLLDNQTPTSDPAIYQDASPVDNIAPQTGPVFILQGTEDTTVPPDQAAEFQQDLQTAGIPYDYEQYIGGHGYLDLSRAQSNMIREQINAFVVNQEHP
jgi:acetyl esterase/lipase